MSEYILKGRVRLNSEPYQDLYDQNPVLDKGEVAITTLPSDTETPIVMIKIGDGVSAFRQLPWLSSLSSDVYDWAKAQSKPTYTASEIKFLDGENFQQKFDSGQLKGNPGYTPIRGVDYWTESDISEIHQYIDTQLGVIENGSY